MNKGLRFFWELESIGINQAEESVHSKYTQEIAFKKGMYEVSLSWRARCQEIPENYYLCVKRFYGLQQQLQQDPSLHETISPEEPQVRMLAMSST